MNDLPPNTSENEQSKDSNLLGNSKNNDWKIDLNNFVQTSNGRVIPLEIIKSENDTENKKWDDLLNTCRIIPESDLHPPNYILHIQDVPVMSLGDFSLTIGKAKSRKTFGMTLVMAALMAKVPMEYLRAIHYKSKPRLVWFDTEQSGYYVQRALRGALKLAGVKDYPELEVYSLRPYSPHERQEIINRVLNTNNPNCDILFAIIDGIRDVVTSINDEEQATECATWLLKLTTNKGMHIATVLHQNKNDLNARGHLGSELSNKAQTVISVEKDKNNESVSMAKPEYMRDQEFKSFAFTINGDGLPEIIPDHEIGTPGEERRKISPLISIWRFMQK